MTFQAGDGKIAKLFLQCSVRGHGGTKSRDRIMLDWNIPGHSEQGLRVYEAGRTWGNIRECSTLSEVPTSAFICHRCSQNRRLRGRGGETGVIVRVFHCTVQRHELQKTEYKYNSTYNAKILEPAIV